jgi:uncharacterized protein YdhG (YjbR/CyaY superfamily)
MAEKKPTRKKTQGFTADERAAMRERAKELKASKNREEAERDLLAKIAAMPAADRALGKKLHALITATAPELAPRLWYGMPAYTDTDGKVVCFFKVASKFKTRYATLGFSDRANLDAGNMWPTDFAVTKLTAAEEKKIAALVKKAVRRK